MARSNARGILRPARLLAAAAALALACAWAAPAWAAEAHPVQSAIEAGASGSAAVNAVGLVGEPGEVVYVTVRRGDAVVADLAPHAIAEGAKGGIADVFSLEADSEEQLAESLASGISVAVYADAAGAELLYGGSVWPVYADLGGAGRKLIGAHTGAGGFAAPGAVSEGGRAYRLSGAAEQSGDEALTFAYAEYDPGRTADGSIRYIDVATGEPLSAWTPIPGLAAGEAPRDVAVPQLVESGGRVYRTMPASATVRASNPDALTFTVPAAELSDSAAAASAGHYMAVIRFVDAETGDAVASDAVWVRGEVAYATPATIYRSAGGSGAEQYDRAEGEPAVIALSAARDGVTTGARTIEVRYGAAAPGAGARPAFALVDGSRRAGDAARTIGTYEGRYPPATYEDADGNAFELVGEPADYGPLAAGMADAYYLPEGHPGTGEPYTVTVSYVDYDTRTEIDSEAFASSPGDLADIAFEPPERFAKDGTTWVRLDGQESISHSYWSNIAKYTVYYRDRSKPAASAPVITRVRVVYRDGGTTAVATAAAGEGAATGAAAAAGADAAGNAAAGAGDAGAPLEERLDSGRSYDVAQGAGSSQQATGQDGRDAVQQRIDEAENPLAGGADAPDGDDAAQGLPAPAIAGIAAAVIAAIAIIAAILVRRARRRV